MKIRFPNYIKAFLLAITAIYMLGFLTSFLTDKVTLDDLFTLKSTIYVVFTAAIMGFVYGVKLIDE